MAQDALTNCEENLQDAHARYILGRRASAESILRTCRNPMTVSEVKKKLREHARYLDDGGKRVRFLQELEKFYWIGLISGSLFFISFLTFLETKKLSYFSIFLGLGILCFIIFIQRGRIIDGITILDDERVDKREIIEVCDEHDRLSGS